ncbi:hypothetical protein LINPERPRIM_LOCUS40196 [Linum perenne]
MMSDSMEVSLISSANDVWGAIIAATAVYPKAMRNLYQQIAVSSFSDDGGFVPTLFDSFDMKITVVRSSSNIKAPGCTVKWEFDFRGSQGNADISNLKRVMGDAFKDLNNYLMNHSPGGRRWR